MGTDDGTVAAASGGDEGFKGLLDLVDREGDVPETRPVGDRIGLRQDVVVLVYLQRRAVAAVPREPEVLPPQMGMLDSRPDPESGSRR